MQGIGLFLSVPCKNGGTHNGIKCICPDGYYGSQCENSNCENGGTWSNGGCLCTSSFQGPVCQYASEVIEVKAVNVKLQITSYSFTTKKGELVRQRPRERGQWGEKSRRSGGTSQERREIGGFLPREGLGDPLLEILEARTEHNTGEWDDPNLGRCGLSSQPPTDPTLSSAEYCQKAAPEGYGQFYFPNLTKSGISCISNCTKSTPGFINCNYGQCQLTRAGPQCICSEQELYWYPTERCATRVSKLGIGLGVAIAVLVIVCAVLGIFLFRARRMKTHWSLQLRQYEPVVRAWGLVPGHLGSLPGSGRGVGAGGSEQGGLGARTPGFSPWLWEGSGGWWVRAGGAESRTPGFSPWLWEGSRGWWGLGARTPGFSPWFRRGRGPGGLKQGGLGF
uniref:EGF-like domain-containing protein n=1 Tax=Chelonoidis abingdonii TaxID=106734 RepID=A0A8C0HC06_CHEAB